MTTLYCNISVTWERENTTILISNKTHHRRKKKSTVTYTGLSTIASHRYLLVSQMCNSKALWFEDCVKSLMTTVTPTKNPELLLSCNISLLVDISNIFEKLKSVNENATSQKKRDRRGSWDHIGRFVVAILLFSWISVRWIGLLYRSSNCTPHSSALFARLWFRLDSAKRVSGLIP